VYATWGAVSATATLYYMLCYIRIYMQHRDDSLAWVALAKQRCDVMSMCPATDGVGKYNFYLSEALGYFYQQLDRIAIAHGKTPIHWVEAFDALGKTGRLDKRAVIQICPSTSTGMCGYVLH
jgi:hypothetical protein